MCENNNLDSQKTKLRRDELKTVIDWRIAPMLDLNKEYKLTIAYTDNSSEQQNIKVIGPYKGKEISNKILAFFDLFLKSADSFGILAKSVTDDEVKNWDISFSKKTKKSDI